MTTANQSNKTLSANSSVQSQNTASSYWGGWVSAASAWFSGSASTPKATNAVAAEKTPVILKAEPATTPKLADDTLFNGWKQIQSIHSSQIHTVKDYQIVEQDDFAVVEVAKEELTKNARKQDQDNLKKYASVEKYSHIVAYSKPGDGSIVEGLEKDGSKASYVCHHLKTEHPGIVAYMLLPTAMNTSGPQEVKVIFRGTNPSDSNSYMRNLECQGGAGSVSFEANSLSLLTQVNQHIKTFKEQTGLAGQDISLGVYGHSLGGADAQNFSTKVLQAVAEQRGVATGATPIPKEAVDHIATTRGLTVNTANSAGVPLTTATLSNELVKKIAEAPLSSGNPYAVEGYNLNVGGDGVQATGQGHILNNVAKEHAYVEVLKAHIGSEHSNPFNLPGAAAAVVASATLGALPAVAASVVVARKAYLGAMDMKKSHTEKLFTAPRTAEYRMMSNTTPEGQKEVAKELSKKSFSLNMAQSVAGTIGNGFSALGYGFSAVQAAFLGGNKPTSLPSGKAIVGEKPNLLFSQAAANANAGATGSLAVPSFQIAAALDSTTRANHSKIGGLEQPIPDFSARIGA